MKIKCLDDLDNNLILKNKEIIEKYHEKNIKKYLKYDFEDLIYVPTVINICVRDEKIQSGFIKYAKYMIDVLNDGFSGKIKSKSKTYSVEHFEKILGDTNGQIVYNYINNNLDTKIRFYLKSIKYHDTTFEYDFTKNKTNTEELIKNFYSKGFKIDKENEYDLNIYVIKFSCDTLGVSTFPWFKYVLNKELEQMMVFIDYKTINPEVSTNKFNQCRTLIHEVGHVFGLKHTFGCKKESITAYQILLGEQYEKIFGKIDSDFENVENRENGENEENLIKLYPDIPTQKYPTIKNPIEKNKFQMSDDVPINFACFMDYSPDELLTHFTNSQSLIMRNIINIFKPKLIRTKNVILESKTILKLPIGKKIDLEKKYFTLRDSKNSDRFYLYKIEYNESDYKIIRDKIKKY